MVKILSRCISYRLIFKHLYVYLYTKKMIKLTGFWGFWFKNLVVFTFDWINNNHFWLHFLIESQEKCQIYFVKRKIKYSFFLLIFKNCHFGQMSLLWADVCIILKISLLFKQNILWKRFYACIYLQIKILNLWIRNTSQTLE